MQAGLLRERIQILKQQSTTNETGGREYEYVEVHRTRAYRPRLTASVGKGINASEEFIDNKLVLQVRKNPFLNEDMHIRYDNKLYKVILLDKQLDNTVIITCSKVNG